MRAIAFRNGTLENSSQCEEFEIERRNVKRSADVSGNARHFCDCELNYTGCEGEWSHPNLTSSKPKGIRQADPFWFIQTVYYFPAQ